MPIIIETSCYWSIKTWITGIKSQIEKLKMTSKM